MIPCIEIDRLERPQGRKSTVMELVDACKTLGFFAVRTSLIDPELCSAIYGLSRKFFDLPEYEKQRYAISLGRDHSGYFKSSNFQHLGTGNGDQSEGFKIYQGPDDCYASTRTKERIPDTIWPHEPLGLKDIVFSYWRGADRLCRLVTSALFEDIAGEKELVDRFFSSPLSNMSLLHYPPSPPNRRVFGISPHTDSDVLTILCPDPVGGLQVQLANGDWIHAMVPPGALILNVGDMLSLWSGGRYRSAPHCVINNTGRERYSFPFFFAPDPEVTVMPLCSDTPFSGSIIKVAETPEYARLLAARERSPKRAA